MKKSTAFALSLAALLTVATAEAGVRFEVVTLNGTGALSKGATQGAFQALGNFMSRPGVPVSMSADFFLFDQTLFDGRLLIGADEFNAAGGLEDSYRLRNIREDTVDQSEFAVAE